MTTAKIGLAGQEVSTAHGVVVRAAQITAVNGDGTVNSRHVGGTTDATNLPFVDVGGTAPSGDYFQAIDSVN